MHEQRRAAVCLMAEPLVDRLHPDVELEEIDKYSALVFTPVAGDSPHAEGNRQAVAAMAASLAGTRSMLKVVIPDFDQVRCSQEISRGHTTSAFCRLRCSALLRKP